MKFSGRMIRCRMFSRVDARRRRQIARKDVFPSSGNNPRMGTFLKLFNRSRADGVTGLAAMVTYNFFLVLPALLIFMVAVLGYLPFSNLSRNLTDPLEGVLPGDAVSLLKRLIEHTLDRTQGQLYILITSLGGSLLVMNSGYAGLISSLNRIYHLEERRRWIRVRLRALIMSIFAAVLIMLTFAMILLSPSLVDLLLEKSPALDVVWRPLLLLRWPIIIGLVIFGMETTYKFAPCCGPRWRFISPGSLFATGSWVLATLGFGFYVDNFNTYDELYGALGAVIVLLIWMWMSSMMFLIGAEINVMWRVWREGTAKQPVRTTSPAPDV